jgi:hypothetical protein
MSQPNLVWYLHAHALALYRAGRFEAAIARCHDSMKAAPTWRGVPLNWLLVAMAHHRLGQAEEARPWLDKAVQWRGGTFNGRRQVDIPYPPEVHLNDWLEFEVLYREAEALVGKDRLAVIVHP